MHPAIEHLTAVFNALIYANFIYDEFNEVNEEDPSSAREDGRCRWCNHRHSRVPILECPEVSRVLGILLTHINSL